jgi:hypothetical protein
MASSDVVGGVKPCNPSVPALFMCVNREAWGNTNGGNYGGKTTTTNIILDLI